MCYLIFDNLQFLTLKSNPVSVRLYLNQSNPNYTKKAGFFNTGQITWSNKSQATSHVLFKCFSVVICCIYVVLFFVSFQVRWCKRTAHSETAHLFMFLKIFVNWTSYVPPRCLAYFLSKCFITTNVNIQNASGNSIKMKFLWCWARLCDRMNPICLFFFLFCRLF